MISETVTIKSGILRHLIIYFLVLLVNSFLGTTAQAQERQLMFKSISIENGLSNNNVTSFLRDSKGFIWIGTVDGLNRFDGYSFKVYKHKLLNTSTIRSNSINYLAEDYQGNIWIGDGDFLEILNPVTDSIIHADSIFEGKLNYESGTRWTFQKDRYGNYWYLSSKQGLYKYFTDEDSLIKVMELPKVEGGVVFLHRLTGFCFDNMDDLWVSDYKGNIRKIQNQSLKITDSINIGTTYNNFYKIFVDSDNDLWIYDWNSNKRDVVFIDHVSKKNEIYNSETTLKLNSDIVKGINQDENGLLWIITDHGGVNLINKKNKTIQYILNDPLNDRSLQGNALTTIYKDYENFIWLGTYKKGVCYYQSEMFKFDHYKIILPFCNTSDLNDINNFTEDRKGNLWFGTNGAGLICYDKKTNTYKQYLHIPTDRNSLSSNIIVGLSTDSKGNIWAGTYFGGLNKWDGKKFTCYRSDTTKSGTLTDDRIWDICEDKDGLLWIVTLLGGVNVFDPVNEKVVEVFQWNNDSSIRSNVVFSILQDSDGLIWIGTMNGLRAYNKITHKFEYFNNNPEDPSSLSSNLVFDILEDSRGLIWAATANGINIIDKKTKKIIQINEDDGLHANRILTLLEDNNHNIWAGSTNGLINVLVNKNDSPYGFKTINYDKLDGLQGKEFNEKAAFKTSDGKLLFGGSNGFNMLIPANINTFQQKNKIVFTDFQVYNKSYSNKEMLNGRYLLKNDISYTHEVTLNYNENLFTIEFSNLNYFHPERHRYQYMMKNFNDSWLEVSGNDRRVTYTNLNPGIYEFIVKVANTDGTVNADSESLKITILPPWWKTLWFKIIFMLGLLAIIILLYIWRFHRLNKQKNLLEKMVDDRTRELTEVNTILEERKEEISIQNEELLNHREKLESVVEMRTKDLEYALKKAEDSDQLKSAFLANMSHEIRTPMNAIVGFANLIREIELPKHEQDDYLNIIIKNCETLLVIINDILDISKIEANQLNINKYEFDLVTLFDSMYSYYKLRKTDLVDIIYEKPEVLNSMIINHDEIRIKQVIQNIVDNALKFTDKGYIKFGFKIDDKYLTCFVEDTGKGIDPKYHHNVFKPFIKIEHPETKFYSGAGLGLAICKRIALLMNGTLNFESELRKGTIFTFTIPL